MTGERGVPRGPDKSELVWNVVFKIRCVCCETIPRVKARQVFIESVKIRITSV